jgi:hypothetical protein
MRSAPPLAALALAVTVLLTGCVPEAPDIDPPPEPTSESVFASDEEALAAATDAYKAYLAMSDLIAQEGGKDPERIAAVAVRDAQDDAETGYKYLQEHQYRSVGQSKIRSVSLQSYSESLLEKSDVAVVYVCLDLTDVDVVDRNGVSVVEASRPDLQPFEVTFDPSTENPRELVVAARQPWAGGNFCDS